MDWLEQRHIHDLDPRAERALRCAGQNFQHDALAEQCLAEAAALAPAHPAVLLAHYRYHLYKHHYPEAEAFARRCLAQVAAKLQLPNDLLATQASHADFTAADPQIRFWLYGMQALSYVVMRRGREAEAIALLRKVIEVDPSDQTKTAILLTVIENAERSE
jgi:tetratricopeptide (TPR) repeat protein